MQLPLEILSKYWGYEHFRPRQLEIVESVLNGNDTLALLPTGGGKSICFQVPAMCMEGLCLVVSPLLALMDDQVRNLKKIGIPAASVSSAQSIREIDSILDNCVYGDIRFLYVSPERLHNELFLERVKKMNINLLAVDEAHCISQWGYDFRPAYLTIAEIRKLKPNVPVLALTASATKEVVADIQEKLLFKTNHVLGTSFARDNLSYIVRKEDDKEAKILEICEKMKGCGIIYCGTRARTKEYSMMLKDRGIDAGYYHAGMSVAERDYAYRKWLNNEQRIICATNAFGMGIDKPDVRFVLHADVPSQPEAYFQEAGRAGRDGKKALAILVYHPEDLKTLEKKVALKFPQKDRIQIIYRQLCNHLQLAMGSGKDHPYNVHLDEFCRKNNFTPTEVYHALQILELAEYLVWNESGPRQSRVHIPMTKHDLYSFQVANPKLDAFIKLLLRMYGGLFEQYIPIKEEDIARNGKLSIQDVEAKLRQLQKLGVLEYEEKSSSSQLTLRTGRVDERSIRLDQSIYESRKRAELERVHAMQRYLTQHKCRSVQLLSYFGEEHMSECGHCDVCREQARMGLSAALFEEMNAAIIQDLLIRPLSADELVKHLPQYPRDQLLEFTRWKIDQKELELNDEMKLVLPGL